MTKHPLFHNDNRSCGNVASDPLQRHNTRHIQLRDIKIQEYVEDGTIIMKWIESKRMYADSLTKASAVQHFQLCRDVMLGITPIVDSDQ